MNDSIFSSPDGQPYPLGEPVNISRRRFLLASAGTAAGALVLGFGLPISLTRAQAAASGGQAAGTQVPAFLEIRPDSTVRLLSPFMEGGQGTFTAMAQIVGEELDADPATFLVDSAPPGEQYVVMDNGMRITGGSMSVRTSYPTMRRLGALARAMLLQAGAERLEVPVSELTTEPGRVVHAASGRVLSYGELAERAMDLPVPDPAQVQLRDPSQFRWIGKPVQRVDGYDKSTGKAIYTIDVKLDGMLHAAVQHAPRLGMTVGALRNEAQVKAMKGVHSIHRLPGAVAVVAERWWHAKRAVEAVQVEWQEAGKDSPLRPMPADFSSDAFRERLAGEPGPGRDAENEGNFSAAFASAPTKVEATYHNQYLNHAQLEPLRPWHASTPMARLSCGCPTRHPTCSAPTLPNVPAWTRHRSPCTHPCWVVSSAVTSSTTAPTPTHRRSLLAKAVGRPVKLIWSREEEFLRDALRPMAVVKFRAALDAEGLPVALEAVSATEGPTEAIAGKQGERLDPSALEGLAGKSYAITHKRIAQVYVKGPAMLGYWRSVGNSMNDFFYEAFLDELADHGKKDPFELRLHLLRGNDRLTHLLQAVAELSGGWKRGPFTAEDGSRRARGVAMASPFGSEAAVIAEVSIEQGQVKSTISGKRLIRAASSTRPSSRLRSMAP